MINVPFLKRWSIRTRILPFLLALPFSGGAQSHELSATFDSKGLASLQFGDASILNNSTVQVSINGKNQSSPSVTMTGERTQELVWDHFKIIADYSVASDTLAYTFTIVNTGSDPIQKLSIQPLTITFPQRPSGGAWFWGYSHSAEDGAPGVIAGDWGSGKLAICLYAGSSDPSAINADQRTSLRLRGPNSYSRTYPVIYEADLDKAINPGEKWAFRGSLRSAPSGTPTTEMAADVYAAFSERFPFILNWPDRRPIGVIFLANSNQKWPTNPRGYFNDRNVDITTEAGQAAFRERLLKMADNTVARLKDMDAQGVIIWDIEGGEMPHAITYLGDPRVLPDHAPEMDAVADEFFARFADAGFKTGVTIRPSKIITRPSTGQPAHQQVDDAIADMSDRIAYAKERWGSTIYYMDTNVTWPIDTRPIEEDLTRGMWQGNATLIPTDRMVELAKQHPDTLIFPEFPRFGYYSAVGIYGETKTGGRVRTPADVRAIYPDAMTVWKLGDVDFQIEWEGLLAGALDGDVQVFRAWFNDWANDFVKLLAQEKNYILGSDEVRLSGDLASQLTDSDKIVRYVAIQSLATPDRQQAQQLLEALEAEKDWVLRRQIINKLGEWRYTPAIPALSALANDGNAKLEYPAIMALAQMGEEATRELHSLATEGSRRVREYALRGFRVNTDPRATPALLKLAEGDNAHITALAVAAIGKRFSPEVETTLIGLLESTNPAILQAACKALGDNQSQAAIEPLVKLVNRAVSTLRNNHVRVAAGSALESITGLRYGPYEQAWKRAFEAGNLN